MQICLIFQGNISKKYSLKSKENFNKTAFKSCECCFAEHTTFLWYALLLEEETFFQFS